MTSGEPLSRTTVFVVVVVVVDVGVVVAIVYPLLGKGMCRKQHKAINELTAYSGREDSYTIASVGSPL